MKLTNLFRIIIFALIINSFLLVTTVWGRLRYLLSYELELNFWGNLLGLLILLGAFAATVCWSVLFVKFLKKKTYVTLSVLVLLAVLPAVYFNTGARTKVCYMENDCVLDWKGCCFGCAPPKESVNQFYFSFRRKLNFCFLPWKGRCPMMDCVPPLVWPHPTCRNNRCVVEFK